MNRYCQAQLHRIPCSEAIKRCPLVAELWIAKDSATHLGEFDSLFHDILNVGYACGSVEVEPVPMVASNDALVYVA